ncbi:MAG: DUF1922 domain-containing protein [Candidatus Bathyarchaeota archaeon]|nr:MAG: DUF1922 domain-containing protein [Candidatus Bathyarchaeota archaeon]
MYPVVVCSDCGRLLVARRDAKSRTCPYCGVRVNLAKAQQVKTAKTAREASKLVQALKKKRRETPPT